MWSFLSICMFCMVQLIVESYVNKCPKWLEWLRRSKAVCPKNSHITYFCLPSTLNHYYVEGCNGPDFDRPGSKRVYSGNFDRAKCEDDRYQPFKFWTNESSDCIFKKSLCTEVGQVPVFPEDDTAKVDRTCRCDYIKGYDFVVKPKDNCACVPSEEDCSCYLRQCSANRSLSRDYICVEEYEASTVNNYTCPPMQETMDTVDFEAVKSIKNSEYNKELFIFRFAVLAFLAHFLVIIPVIACEYTFADEYSLGKKLKYLLKGLEKNGKNEWKNKPVIVTVSTEGRQESAL